IDTRVYFLPDTSCTPLCSLLVACNHTTVQLHCPGCLRKGLHSRSYEIHRTTYGYQDCDNDNRWDPDSSCNPQVITELYALEHPQVKSRRAMVGDVLKGTLGTRVENNSYYGPVNDTLVFHYAYWESRISGGWGQNFKPD